MVARLFRQSEIRHGGVARTIVFKFTPEGAPSKLRLGGGFFSAERVRTVGRCQAAPDAGLSTATRSPRCRSHRSSSDENYSTANPQDVSPVYAR
jgi:hypothetical protein